MGFTRRQLGLQAALTPREMSRAIRQGDPEGDGIDISMLKHISPIEWSNVILYGTYKLNRSRIRRPHIEPPGSVQLTL